MEFKERLYDYEKVEWEKILSFIDNEENVSKTSKKSIGLNKFQGMEGAKPIEIYQTWQYSKGKVEFEIVCLSYNYIERERLGDGQMGSPSRVTNFIFTSFWFISKNSIKIPKIIIEPTTVVQKLQQLMKKNQFYGQPRFNLRYVTKTNNPEKIKSIFSNYIQELFSTYYKIWFECSGDFLLVRDDRPINLEYFRKKFFFTKELIRKLN